VSTETTNARALAAMLRERWERSRFASAHNAPFVITITEEDHLAIAAELERLADLEEKKPDLFWQPPTHSGEPLGELSDGA
jgi:hypothetical protein